MDVVIGTGVMAFKWELQVGLGSAFVSLVLLRRYMVLDGFTGCITRKDGRAHAHGALGARNTDSWLYYYRGHRIEKEQEREGIAEIRYHHIDLGYKAVSLQIVYVNGLTAIPYIKSQDFVQDLIYNQP